MVDVVTTLTAIGAGLMGGFFLAFAVSVMPGMRRRPPAEAAGALQAINRAIMNRSSSRCSWGRACSRSPPPSWP